MAVKVFGVSQQNVLKILLYRPDDGLFVCFFSFTFFYSH